MLMYLTCGRSLAVSSYQLIGGNILLKLLCELKEGVGSQRQVSGDWAMCLVTYLPSRSALVLPDPLIPNLPPLVCN